jgi:hypothetical protein
MQAPAVRSTDLSVAVKAVLQTVHLTGEKFGVKYLVQVLKGWDEPGQAGRPDMPETRGSLGELRNLVHHLLDEGYLRVRDSRYGTVALDARGHAWLAAPESVHIRPRVLDSSPHDRMLLAELRQTRRLLSTETGQPPFMIFTDYTLREIILRKPEDLAALMAVPGINDYKANRFGPAILHTLREVRAKAQAAASAAQLRKLDSPAYTAVREMFLAGMQVEDIAALRSVKVQTVQAILYALHQGGRINLRPWIETTVDAGQLSKASHWFQQSGNARLRDAYEALGLDYDTLRLCRLYVAGVSSHQEELRAA